MPLSALPLHLQKTPEPAGDGTDQDNALQKHWSRAWTAYGPNADKDDRDWLTLCGIPWTKRRLCLPIKLPAKWRRFPMLLIGYNVTRWMPQGDAGGERRVWALADRWIFLERALIWNRDGEKMQVGPSPIQSGAKCSLVVTWPIGFSFSLRWKWRGKIKTFFVRAGARWDSLDDYTVFPSFFIGGAYN